MTRVLFVCLGNICRSPLAEGILRSKVTQAGLSDAIEIDSAGTGNWHVGEAPDARAQACAKTKGIDISTLRARQFVPEDFQRFDYVLVSDQQNLQDVLRLARNESDKYRVSKILDYLEDAPTRDVPDPYFGGADGFDHVYEMLDASCTSLLQEIRKLYEL